MLMCRKMWPEMGNFSIVFCVDAASAYSITTNRLDGISCLTVWNLSAVAFSFAFHYREIIKPQKSFNFTLHPTRLLAISSAHLHQHPTLCRKMTNSDEVKSVSEKKTSWGTERCLPRLCAYKFWSDRHLISAAVRAMDLESVLEFAPASLEYLSMMMRDWLIANYRERDEKKDWKINRWKVNLMRF